jgi:hypothetical protein
MIFDCRLRTAPLWRLTNMLIKVRNDALTLRDVKNETTSGDVHENKATRQNVMPKTRGFCRKMHLWREN